MAPSGSTGEREVLESEVVSSDENPDEVLSALTRSLDTNTATLSGVEPTKIEVYNTGSPADRSPEGMALWRQGLQALGRADNVLVKISDLVAYDNDWSLDSLRPVKSGGASGLNRLSRMSISMPGPVAISEPCARSAASRDTRRRARRG